MPANLELVCSYLDNVQFALANGQTEHAQFLAARAQEILGSQLSNSTHSPLQLPMHIGVGLNRGRKRWATPNEDCVFAATSVNVDGTPFGLFLVADGAGGHILGQQAARLALQVCVEYLFSRLREGGLHGTALRSLLVEAVQEANRRIYLQNEEKVIHEKRMCATITVMIAGGSEASVANVGDSRTYHYNPTTGLTQITRDHSVVADMVASQEITRDQMRTHRERHKIYRGLGDKPEVEVDVFSGPVQVNDMFLLCSDGLWEMVSDEVIRDILASSTYTQPSTMAEQLVSCALINGGLDNIGVVVVQVKGIDMVGGEQTIVVAPARVLSPR